MQKKKITNSRRSNKADENNVEKENNQLYTKEAIIVEAKDMKKTNNQNPQTKRKISTQETLKKETNGNIKNQGSNNKREKVELK